MKHYQSIVLLVIAATTVLCEDILYKAWDYDNDGPLNGENMCSKIERNGYQWEPMKRYPAGLDIPYHTHPTDRLNGFLDCTVMFEMYGKTVRLVPGDVLFVPRDILHKARVLPGKDCLFFNGVRKDKFGSPFGF